MDASGFSQRVCNRWIDEVAGTRCCLNQGHDGPCKAKEDQTDGR